MSEYKIAPEDSAKWKCDWLNCSGGMGLAGNGYCSFRGEWDKKKCAKFIAEEDFLKREKEPNAKQRKRPNH